MHRSLPICLLTITLAVQARPEPAAQPSFADPGIAPDGSEIAFVSGGDIWTVPAAGGQARLLISHAANDTHPVYSPDKSQLAFVSTRTGGGDVYVLTLASGDVRRVTFDDGLEHLDGWSRDGKWLRLARRRDRDIVRTPSAPTALRAEPEALTAHEEAEGSPSSYRRVVASSFQARSAAVFERKEA